MSSTNGVRSDKLSSVEESIDAVSNVFQIPTFSENLIIWIKQVEMIFEINKITTEKSKFLRLASSLPTHVLSEHWNYVDKESTSPYSELKTSLLRTTMTSQYSKVRDLINIPNNPNRTPTQTLGSLISRFSDLDPNTNWKESNIIKAAFIQTLPVEVRIALATDKTKDVKEMANIAEELIQLVDERRDNFSVHTTTENRNDSNHINAMNEKNPRNYPISPHKDSKPNTLCYFHQRFGKLARKCQPPCTWISKQGNGETSQ